MAQPQMLQIKLSRFDAQPWGFRLQGGVDFAAPLLVQKVNGGSLAEQAGLMPGDAVIKINDVDVYNLRHKDAQDIVVRSGNNFVVTVQRGGSTWRPHVTPTGHLPQPNSPYLQTVTKTSLAHKQQESQHIGCGYNNAAKPFGNGVDGNVKSIVNKQYNSPVGIYSDESIAETLSAQAEVLAGGVLGVNFKKNEKEYQAEKSEVLKFLREEESGPSTPAFNHHPYQEPQHHQQQHQHQHQQNQYHHQQQQSATRHVTAPVTQPKPPSTGGLPTGQNICAECERLITGVFVRIKDRNLHVECFKCATCGTSLKNQGYYNFNNKLYCDIHAKLAALQNPPSGTEGYVPVPIKPNTKLSASTISSALNAHGYNNGISNGSSTPIPVNQGGYARPYGAAPKSPVSYPPQQQQQQHQWNQPPPTQPKPAIGNAYATLPRTNVSGQQGRKTQSMYNSYHNNYSSNYNTSTQYNRKSPSVVGSNRYSTMPSSLNTTSYNNYCNTRSYDYNQETLIKPSMLSETLPRKINAKPRNNACLANATASLQQTDLTNDDPTAMLNESLGKINMGQKMDNFMAEAGKVISNMLESRLANNGNGMPSPHSSSSLSLRSNSSSNLSRSPMVVRKRLDLDDFKDINPSEPAALKPVIALVQNVELKADNKLQPQTVKGVQPSDLPVNHPMGKVLELCDNKMKPQAPLTVAAKAPENATTGLPPSETVIYRDRSNRRASHATDRRSYIEPNTQSEQQKDGAIFSISVKPLGKPGDDPNKPMSPENEEVVSQLLKDGKKPICCQCNCEITSGPFITALGKIWCPEHFHCVNGNCRRPLQDIGFVEEKGDLYCEYCFEKYLAPTCSKCNGKIKGDCLNAIGKHFHPECFACGHCGKLFGNTPFFLEDGMPYCEADWNELFTTKCFACGFPVEAGDRWVEALNHNYHSQCFNCTYCKQNLEGQSFYNKGGRPFCKNHAR